MNPSVSSSFSAPVPSARVGDLNPADFPEELRLIIVKLNEGVRAAKLAMDRASNLPQHLKAPISQTFMRVRAVQAMLGGAGRVLLEQLADWKEIGVSHFQTPNKNKY
jgi:hypothetical protein